jgi:ketosteroid isomerase-like protein
MNESANTQIVKDAYAAFARGDIPAILAMLDPSIEWTAVAGAEVPTAGTRRGPTGVAQFFEDLAGAVAFERFEPREFIAQGDKVVALGYYSARAKPTGQPFASEWVMVFTVRNGKVTRFVEYADSLNITRAFAAAGV